MTRVEVSLKMVVILYSLCVCLCVHSYLQKLSIFQTLRGEINDTPIKPAPNFSLDYAMIISSVDGCDMSPKEEPPNPCSQLLENHYDAL